MKIALLSPKWGPVNLLRQTKNYSGIASLASFHIHPSDFHQCDYAYALSEEDLPSVMEFSKNKRFYICMENPQIWSPSIKFLSNFGTIFTPFPDLIKDLPSDCNVVQSYPCVPWFYDINFCTNSGLLHVPLKSNSELSQMLSFPMPSKTKLISLVLSAKDGGAAGYSWRIQLANSLKKYFGDLLDIYGFGHNPLPNKRTAFDPYLITIVCENSSHPYYITEKIADAVLGWSTPIYCGSKSLSHLLPEYQWTLEFGSDVEVCCMQVQKYIRQILDDTHVLSSSRSILLRRLNLFEEIPRLLAQA